jgi:hypothetical protein
MQTQTTTVAAERPKRSPPSARDIAVRVMREMPTSSLEAQCRRFEELVSEHQSALSEALARSFINYKRDIEATKTKAYRDETRARHAVGLKAQEEAVEKAVHEKAESMAEEIKTRFLDLTMPNNKPMRECVGSEMAAFGWAYQKIAKKVGPENKVGDVLAEAEVAKLIGKAAS